MVAKRVEIETVPESNSDALTDTLVRIKANEVLLYGKLDNTKKTITYGEYSVGCKGTVYYKRRPIGLIKDWSEVRKNTAWLKRQ